MRPHINSFAALLKKSFITGVFECSNSHRTKNFHNTVQKHKSIVWMFCKASHQLKNMYESSFYL